MSVEEAAPEAGEGTGQAADEEAAPAEGEEVSAEEAEEAPTKLEVALHQVARQAAEEAITKLDEHAEATVAEQRERLAEEAKSLMEQTAEEVTHAQEEDLKDITLPAEEKLEEFRQDLNAARAEVIREGHEGVKAAAQKVNTESITQLEGLKQEAANIGTEAQTLAQKAADAMGMTETSADRANTEWSLEESMRDAEMAAKVEGEIPSAEGKAMEAKLLSTLTNRMGDWTMGIIQQAQRHARNASALALEAVQQGALNAQKLNSIRMMVEQAEHSVQVATHGDFA